MHDWIGHPGKEKFEQMLKSTGNYNENAAILLNKLYEKCLTCHKFKKNIPRPKVAPPIGTDFNHTIAVYLKIWPKMTRIIVYIIDLYSRYTMAIVVQDKSVQSIIQAIMDSWILNLFGPPSTSFLTMVKNFQIRK